MQFEQTEDRHLVLRMESRREGKLTYNALWHKLHRMNQVPLVDVNTFATYEETRENLRGLIGRTGEDDKTIPTRDEEARLIADCLMEDSGDQSQLFSLTPAERRSIQHTANQIYGVLVLREIGEGLRDLPPYDDGPEDLGFGRGLNF